MSKKDPNKYIKKKTPKNASGAIKKALEALETLKKSSGNPKAQDAVGASNLAAILAQVAQTFGKPSETEDDFCGHAREQLVALQGQLASLQAITPPTPEIKASIDEINATINTLRAEMIKHKCPLPQANTANTQGFNI